MAGTAPSILCINASLRGAEGNSARLMRHLLQQAPSGCTLRTITLTDYQRSMATLVRHMRASAGFVFFSGVYWNSHGSVLQRFLEVMTAWETTDLFVGKPAGVVLSMDSVGGMEVAARLLGVLNLFGCTVPPLGTVVLSRVAQAATGINRDDVYAVADMFTLLHNVVAAAKARPAYASWPVTPTQRPVGVYSGPAALSIDQPPWVAAD